MTQNVRHLSAEKRANARRSTLNEGRPDGTSLVCLVQYDTCLRLKLRRTEMKTDPWLCLAMLLFCSSLFVLDTNTVMNRTGRTGTGTGTVTGKGTVQDGPATHIPHDAT